MTEAPVRPQWRGRIARHQRLILAVITLMLLSFAGVMWFLRGEERVKSVIPPSVNAGTITFESRPHGIKAESIDLARVVETSVPGRLTWSEDRTTRIRSPFAGRVVRSLVRAGDSVEAGQALAEIFSSDFGRVQADYHLALAEFERAKLLFEAGIMSRRELQSSEAGYKRAKAEYSRSQPVADKPVETSRDGLFVLRSPISGTVVETSINPGQELGSEQDAPPLYIVSDPGRLWVWVDLSEMEIGQVSSLRLPLAVSLRSAALPERKFAASLVHFSDALDPVSRTFRMRGVVENPGRELKGAMFVQVSLPMRGVQDESDQQLVIPASAVFLMGEKRYIFIQHSETRYTRQEVTVIREIAGRAIVTGISLGQLVVTEGNLYLQQILMRAERAAAAQPSSGSVESGRK